jgi:hypothetical protein
MARTEEIRARWCCLEDRAVPLAPIEGPHPAEDVKHLLSRVERLEAVREAAKALVLHDVAADKRERLPSHCFELEQLQYALDALKEDDDGE